MMTDYATVEPHEHGLSFGLSHQSYARLASAALSLGRDWPDSSLFIRKLEGSGAAVEIYTTRYLFTLSVWPGAISLVVESLDFANSEHLLFSGKDSEADWQLLKFAANRLLP
jgi:hypothetical protein